MYYTKKILNRSSNVYWCHTINIQVTQYLKKVYSDSAILKGGTFKVIAFNNPKDKQEFNLNQINKKLNLNLIYAGE